ncbi:MAG: hypothetical protein IPM24_23035 [Bryobacterales bacterium]|nr:hypothetical protein [Bryobacterales bacterium]
MTRREWLWLAAVPLRAGEAIDLFAALATEISEGDAEAALRWFDRRLPGYDKLAAALRALLSQNDVGCSIEFRSRDELEFEMDWQLDIRTKELSGIFERRQERVRSRVEKQGRSWRIVAFEPVSVFDPPRP